MKEGAHDVSPEMMKLSPQATWIETFLEDVPDVPDKHTGRPTFKREVHRRRRGL
jgi:hypothetical protein